MPIIVNKLISVAEFQQDIDTNILLKNNDWIDISASGSVWGGIWFTNPNGPEGFTNWMAGNNCPLPGRPLFSLLGKTAEDGYFLIGGRFRGTYLNRALGPGETKLWLRINDDQPGNGSGSFSVSIQVWR